LNARDRRDDELGDTLERRDLNCDGAKVDEQDAHLPSVIRVDGAGRVEHRQAVAQGEAGARAHLSLEAVRQFEAQPCRNQPALTGFEPDGLRQGCTQIEPGGPARLIARQWNLDRTDALDSYVHLHVGA
jgi:hypothetical protein